MSSTEYKAATYSNVLDSMLKREMHPGQGEHPEANAAEVKAALARLDLYPFLATAVADVFGMEQAEPLLRVAVRNLGRYRGNAIRRRVEKLGLPLDVLRLLEYWDHPWATEEAAQAAGYRILAREPHYFAIDVPGCTFHDQMRRLCPQRLAYLMCEEDHLAIAREFNPAIDVWYPSLLTRGEGKCSFLFSMPLEEAEKAARQAERLAGAARNSGRSLDGQECAEDLDAAHSYRALALVIVVFYHFIADELLREVGEQETETLLRRASKAWGAWRGEMMRQDHLARGWPLDVEHLIRYSDDPAAGDAWVAENVVLTSSRHEKHVTVSPFAAGFEDVGTGPLAALMVEEGLPAQAQAYNPDIKVEIAALMERGDPISTHRYTQGR